MKRAPGAGWPESSGRSGKAGSWAGSFPSTASPPTSTAVCETLYNGVDLSRFGEAAGDPAKYRRSFLMLGRLGERKGVYDLIEAMALAVRQDPDLTLCLAGDGQVEEVRALVAQRGLENNIEVLGWVGEEEKRRRLEKAATVVLLSYYEGLPLFILEGMAAGKAARPPGGGKDWKCHQKSC